MVKTTYPPVLKTMNRGVFQIMIVITALAWGSAFPVGIHYWKNQRLPRLRHNDPKYLP